MLFHMSIHRPKTEYRQDLIDSMHRYGAAAEGQPGLREVHTLADRHSDRLVGLAIWEDEASWRAGVESMRAAVENDPFDLWEEREPEGFMLEDV